MPDLPNPCWRIPFQNEIITARKSPKKGRNEKSRLGNAEETKRSLKMRPTRRTRNKQVVVVHYLHHRIKHTPTQQTHTTSHCDPQEQGRATCLSRQF